MLPSMLLYVIAALSSLALTSALICISSHNDRIEFLERDVKLLLDDDYRQDESLPQKECPFCHAYIDEDEDVCPYCKNEGAREINGEYFATEDPDYKGTDFSGEEYVSSYTDDKSDI